MKKILAAGLIAAGLVIGTSAVAHATPSQYVTVAWSYAGYPDISKPQPFIAAAPGTDLHVFDSLASSPEWCGKPLQVDVYHTEVNGVSWEGLNDGGVLNTSTDGAFLAYDVNPQPYRVITPEEYPCTIPNPEPTPTETPSSGSPTPSASSSPTPSASSSPTAPVTGSPSASPSPTGTPTPSSSPSASTAPVPSSSPTTKPSPRPTVTATPSAPASAPSSTPSASPSAAVASASRTGELAYTGNNPWPGIGAASVLVAAGLIILLARRVRRA